MRTIRELETQLKNNKAKNHQLQKIARNYYIRARLLQNRTFNLKTYLELHAEKLFRLTNTFKKEIIFQLSALSISLDLNNEIK